MAKPHRMGTDRVCQDCNLTDTEINADLPNSRPCVPSHNPKDEYTSHGKQVLLNGWHYADAFDEEAANAIAYAMNSVYLAKVGPVFVRDPICPACKHVGMHAPNCTEGR